MKRITATVALALDERVPPKEIQLWSVGDNPTDYGVHKWTERSISTAYQTYATRGNLLLVDIEHAGASTEDKKPTVTAGYARLELRAGAPWLTFEWATPGVEQITTGQRRYLSPDYAVDEATGEIVALYRVSLVAEPGTHRARVLASSAIGKEPKMEIAVFLAALRAALAAEDPAVAKQSVESLIAEFEKVANGNAGDTPATPEAAAAPPEEDKPVMAAADDKKDDDKKDVEAAAPMKTSASAKAPTAPAPVAAESAEAIAQIKAARRDLLLQTDGDRLPESIRRWAASQPFEVVQGLIDHSPARGAAPVRASATRGATQGETPAKGLQGKEKEELDKAMGIQASVRKPFETDEYGRFVLHTTARLPAAGKAGE